MEVGTQTEPYGNLKNAPPRPLTRPEVRRKRLRLKGSQGAGVQNEPWRNEGRAGVVGVSVAARFIAALFEGRSRLSENGAVTSAV